MGYAYTMYIITQKKVKMHYRSYDLSFGHAADPLKAFGKQYFVGLKAIQAGIRQRKGFLSVIHGRWLQRQCSR